jgi:nucleoside-diphosphate-sugar epimerase
VPREEYEHLHVAGTANVMRACREAGTVTAIVHCSTTGVLGPTGDGPAHEHSPQHPCTPYEQSKARGEQIACAIAERFDLPLAIARPSLVYGPGDRHLLGWFRAIQRGYYRVVGRGDNLIHPVFIDDVAEGLIRCGNMHGRVDGVPIYNLVGPEPMPIREFASAIARAVGRPLPRWHLPRSFVYAVAGALELLPIAPARLPVTRSRVAFMTEMRQYSGARARAELAFEASTGVDAGLRQTVTWYRQEALL